MSSQKAFSIAELLASHNLPCKLWRTSDGVWHVKCVDRINTEGVNKYNELFGDMK
jgi:hypothetical protein